MGMFDSYIADPPLACPACGEQLDGWQGKDGPCLLFHWQQGHRFPVATDWPGRDIQDQDTEGCLKSSDLLPSQFLIYTDGCSCDRIIRAFGKCVASVWTEADLETHLTASPETTESDHEFQKRVADLQKWVTGAAS